MKIQKFQCLLHILYGQQLKRKAKPLHAQLQHIENVIRRNSVKRDNLADQHGRKMDEARQLLEEAGKIKKDIEECDARDAKLHVEKAEICAGVAKTAEEPEASAPEGHIQALARSLAAQLGEKPEQQTTA